MKSISLHVLMTASVLRRSYLKKLVNAIVMRRICVYVRVFVHYVYVCTHVLDVYMYVSYYFLHYQIGLLRLS